MQKQLITSIITLTIVTSAACKHVDGYTPKEEQNAKKVQSSEFYKQGKGSPAQFITDLRARLHHEAAIVRGEKTVNYTKAVKKLSALYQEAEKGFNWKEPLPTAEIPHLAVRPIIDGTVKANEWSKALCFKGEYMLNKNKKTPHVPSLWYVGWTNTHLYFAARFLDADLNIFSGKLRDPAPSRIYEGDSLELFIRPCLDQLLYYEYIINPAGKQLSLMHGNNRYGGHALLGNREKAGQVVAAAHDSKGFSVEIAVPLNSLHGFWCKRTPRSGDTFGFILVRTNLNAKNNIKSSPVPFLYDGHNIFGYIKAKLK